MLTWRSLIVPFIRRVSGAKCPNNACKLSCVGGDSESNYGGSGGNSGLLPSSGTGSSSSAINRNRDDEHL